MLIAVIADTSVFTVWSRDVPDMLVCEVCASASSMWVSVRGEFCVVGVLFNNIGGGLGGCCGLAALAYDVLGGVVIFQVFVGGVV